MQINVNVGTDIMYVGGTVNGVESDFNRLYNGLFYTNVKQAKDDKYKFDLELVDEAGNVSQYKETLTYELPFFVYDRTAADVERVKYLNNQYKARKITEEELEEWKTGINEKVGLKGALNLADFNRNEKNCQFIGELMDVAVNTKTWVYGMIPRPNDYQRLKENVQALRDHASLSSSTPEVPDRPFNTYQKWNDIEKILYDVYQAFLLYMGGLYYADDEIYAGDGVGIL